MLVKFHNGEMQVNLHDKDGERVVALLGPTSGKDRKPFMSETLTTWRADLIEYFLRIAPPELTVRTVFVVPEFLGIIEEYPEA